MATTPGPHRHLIEMLDDPREDLAVEIKAWLDLEDRVVGANLARELIALANHGGGTILFGFADEPTGWQPSGPCPYPDSAYSQDSINNLCKRHAEPAFHCGVHRLVSALGNTHVVVEVPGGHRVPVRAKRGGPEGSRLRADVYYVRRPGPESAPVGSGQEWDTLLRRCIGAQRDELLASFRTIATALGAGGPGALGVLEGTREVPLTAWRKESREQLSARIAHELPDEEPSRYAAGTYSAAYRVLHPTAEPSLQDLLSIISEVRGHETGWPPWLVFHQDDMRPIPVRNVIEAWLRDTTFEDGAHSDFWRVSTDGKAYMLRGYDEDSEPERIPPGSLLDLTLPVWRTGECLLHAARFAERLGGTGLEFGMEWSGLQGRRLKSRANRDYYLPGEYVARQNDVTTVIETDLRALADTLPEIVRALVEPLYASFDFFRPAEPMYAKELAKLRDRGA